MYRVLVPVDDDRDRAIAQAEFVAALPCATEEVGATVAHALEAEEREATGASASRISTVRAAGDILEEAGVAFETTDLELPPARGIMNWADEMDADLIVVSGRERSPAGKAVFGSVSQTVILESDRPVTVVRPD